MTSNPRSRGVARCKKVGLWISTAWLSKVNEYYIDLLFSEQLANLPNGFSKAPEEKK
jgi:hypothetical protein